VSGGALNSTQSILGEPHLRATGCHLLYGITQCYLPPDTSEHALPNPSHAGWYSIYLPWWDGRLSWPSWLDSTLAGSQTSDHSPFDHESDAQLLHHQDNVGGADDVVAMWCSKDL